MNVLVDNVSTNNKGAELMIYAVLQELERKYPDADVMFPLYNMPEGLSSLNTTMNCKQRKIPAVLKLFKKMKGDSILRRVFRIPYSFTTDKYPGKGIDIVLDAGGFQFSDQFCESSMYMKILDNYYKKMKKMGTKIIFLSQAFGPFETECGMKYVEILKNVDAIIARDEMSYSYLMNTDIDKRRILLYPDFTALVDGVFPVNFDFLKNGIAIIPNFRMIDKGMILLDDYIKILIKIISICRTEKKEVFLLNHEGQGDFVLCENINSKLNKKLPIVSDLNALEIKGLISQCYFVFSSRFHGLANALSSGVPCLATSWSHKYKMLFNDYNMEGCILELDNTEFFFTKMSKFLDADYNHTLRNKLKTNAENIKNKNREMWQLVWMS